MNRFAEAPFGLLLAVTTLAVPATAYAATPVGDAPPSKTTTPSPSSTLPARPGLTSLYVTTDSVVATATIHYTGTPSITVRWGDNATSTFNTQPRIPTGGIGQTFTPGEAVLQHVYDTANGQPFSEIVTAQVDTATDSRNITITPRYRVNQYRAIFGWYPTEACEPFYEEQAEWRVTQSVSHSIGNAVVTTDDPRTWRFDTSTGTGLFSGSIVDGNPIYDTPLPNSEVQLDLTLADWAGSSFGATELDSFEDDVLSGGGVGLSPTLGTRTERIELGSGDCHASIKADINVALLRPVLSGGPLSNLPA
jgi:hypothetical protein